MRRLAARPCDALDPARAQPHHAVAALRQRRVVRHQHQRGAALRRGRRTADRRSRAPVASSRLPVGSSAIRIAGLGASARASATRCCSPPDSSRRIVIAAARASRPRRAPAPRARGRRRRRQARAAPRRSPARSWSGSGGRTGTRCRHCGRGSARARPRRARRGPAPAIVTEPVSGRSSPAITISRVDLPEPDGPTMPIASPRPILRAMSLRICTRAAPRPSERLTPVSAIAAPLPQRGVVHAVPAPAPVVIRRPAHMGTGPAGPDACVLPLAGA